VVNAMRSAAVGLLNLLFPEDCRVCGESLNARSSKRFRVPVCTKCLARPESLAADFYCVACHTPFVNQFPLDETGRCGLCRQGLQGFDAVYSFASYEGRLRQLLHLFKYDRVRSLAPYFGEWLALTLPTEQAFDVIVPMPLHWAKRRERGFNQAKLLAKEVSRRWNVPVRSVVRRRKSTASQAGLTNSKRRANVRGAFKIRHGIRLDGLRVLLVDDVFTTGSTASACARVLKRAGAQHVAILVVGRTDRRLALDIPNPQFAVSAAGSPTL
jgi:ComF family protein